MMAEDSNGLSLLKKHPLPKDFAEKKSKTKNETS